MSQFKNLQLEKGEGIARLVLDRPPLNVLNIEAMIEMNRALEELKLDNTIKVLVISGKGKGFCAGVDVADHTEEKVEEMLKQFHDIFFKLSDFQPVTVAQVHGVALGGGCELAIFCDLIIASADAKFGQPEIKVGVFPPIAAIAMPRLMPSKRALELLLTGEMIDAQEAFKLGLVNKVVPGEELANATEALVARLKEKSGVVLKLTKKVFKAVQPLDFRAGVKRAEEIYLKELMATDDAKEGLAAFIRKRAPLWKER